MDDKMPPTMAVEYLVLRLDLKRSIFCMEHGRKSWVAEKTVLPTARALVNLVEAALEVNGVDCDWDDPATWPEVRKRDRVKPMEG
jgi:hypothetical protein